MINDFENYYQNLYGDRWIKLRDALVAPKNKYILKINKFADFDNDNTNVSLISSAIAPIDLKFCYQIENIQVPSPAATTNGLFNYYLLDLASILAVSLLDIKENDLVLDMCAAPGGKTLCIVDYLQSQNQSPSQGKLVANELSNNRRMRLIRTLKNYLPSELINEKIKIKGFDASKWCLLSNEKNKYDKILLDAPCSSEGHLLKSTDLIAQWKVNRTKYLSKMQYSMLCSALQCLKVGGKIAYCTCSISPLENDFLIDKLINDHRRKERFNILSYSSSSSSSSHKLLSNIAENTKYGKIILPDNSGWGPLFIAVLERIS
ncbi:MAG: hypothetical protein HQK51_00210 [Oligoflexia bacterium]|nr:hypothetical protein [Oligoflexia bacterium]